MGHIISLLLFISLGFLCVNLCLSLCFFLLWSLHQVFIKPEHGCTDGSVDGNKIENLHWTTHLGDIHKSNVDGLTAVFAVVFLYLSIHGVVDVFHLVQHNVLIIGKLQFVSLWVFLLDIELTKVDCN